MPDNGIAGAWRLEGLTLSSGWKVLGPVGWDPRTGEIGEQYQGTGGNFSKPYRVEKDGKTAFLKAIDLTKALQEEDVMEALHRVTTEHQFEVEILNICSGAKMDRVVVALDSGQEKLGDGYADVVPYLIFELADGDVRKRQKRISPELKLSWWLRALHHASVGLKQLHSRGIAHQDLKPSNILSFDDDTVFKLGDLGRSICEGKTGPFDHMIFSGDRTYAPFEILYGLAMEDVRQRRLACDCYMLGSMIFFFGLGMGASQLVLTRLNPENLPLRFGGGWSGTYAAVVPVLQNEFSKVLEQLADALGDGAIGSELVTCAQQLCNPDPMTRGHPKDILGGEPSFSLERYVSIFDRLAARAAIEARKGN